MKKRLLSMAIIGAMLCSLLIVPAFAKDFPDASGHWAETAIQTWSDRGVVNGDDAGNFRPGDSITRAETAKLMDNLIGFEETSNKAFDDVDKDAWYAQSINKLYAAEVLTGYEDGTIRPGNSISRQEAAVIIARAFALETDKADQSILANFSDNDQIQDWARPVIAFMAERGFIQGSDGMFRPGDPITRAEVVTILNNMVGIYADGTEEDYTGDYGNKIAIIKAPTIFDGVTLGGAVICGGTDGKVNFNSGSKINGCVCNWANDATVSTAGATVSSTENKGDGSISSGGNFSAGYGGSLNSGMGGSVGGGSVGGGSIGGGTAGGTGGGATPQYTVTFYANGGAWDNVSTQNIVTYTMGNSYALRLPTNPTRNGYVFEGWYTDQVSANNLTAERKLNTTELVTSTSCKVLYAGWKIPSGLYGTVSVSTGDNLANRGKSAAELMDGVTLTNASAIDHYNIAGGLRYVSDYSNSPTLNTAGNFLALTYTLPESITNPAGVTLKSGFSDSSSEAIYRNFTSDNKTYTRVFEITPADLLKEIVFTVDLDSANINVGSIVVNLSSLVRYEFITATTVEEFTAALNNPAAEQITVTAPLTLPSGTYGQESTKKKVVLEQPISLAKDASVTLQSLDITVSGTHEALITNVTEIPEGETEPVATKAAALTLKDITLSSDELTALLSDAKIVALTVTNSVFTNNEFTATAMILAPEATDSLIIEGNTFKGYTTALQYRTVDALLKEGNKLNKNAFLNNTTDVKIDVAATSPDAIPGVAYNYFDDAPVVAGTSGDLNVILSPLYTDAEMTTLSENLHDAFVFVDGTYSNTLSAIDSLAFTFENAETTHEILLIPMDARNTAITINEEAVNLITLTDATVLPGEYSIKVGEGTAKLLTITKEEPLQ